MINREMKQVIVNVFSNTPDSYGQLHKSTPTGRYVDMMIKNKSIVNVNDPRFIDVTDIGLTKDREIKAGNEVVDNDKTYLVLYVIPSSRLTQVMLKLCR